MIRTSVALSINTLTVRNLNAYDHIISNGPHIQCVRWKRKPIWLPTAKSKLFRIPNRPVIPIEEYNELKRLHNNYKTLMKSIMSFFVEKHKEVQVSLDTSVVQKNMQQDFEICCSINDKWNKEVAMIREERLARERKARQEEIAKRLQAKYERDLKLQMKIDEEIKKAKEEAQTFITSKNIDEAILNALENIIDHNIAIDRNGNFYKDKPKENESSTVSSSLS
ncbi:probable 28S ribosomal protein S26, mitochondrial isoform X1 [Bombus vosnesenskii]|uniref:Small ribosomal subunit protein mS26 n=1 Tax=Bombus vosnesenskii TaxID=207650 RepID=A0A6J3JV83_9HYME|nr:probable 28S ribosomal protein S26, mitochondrial isoform X1 [Bombus vosnesenskii]XP_033344120.1 probable 28S ribosomal protein S26, mitochondrial isoform X1 [Bombus vosnesenskii]